MSSYTLVGLRLLTQFNRILLFIQICERKKYNPTPFKFELQKLVLLNWHEDRMYPYLTYSSL